VISDAIDEYADVEVAGLVCILIVEVSNGKYLAIEGLSDLWAPISDDEWQGVPMKMKSDEG